MANFYVSGHYPNINQEAIPRNPEIRVIFNKALRTSSIDYRTISVHDDLYTTIPGTEGWDYTSRGTSSGMANILTFTPSILLASNTRYTVYVHRKPDSVISMYDDQLDDSYTFSFITGSGSIEGQHLTREEQLELDLQRAIDLEDWELAAQIQALLDSVDESGVLPTEPVISGQPVPEVIEDLALTSSYPTNGQGNVSLTNLKFIKLGFNDVIYSSGIAFERYISVVKRNVLS